MWKGSSREARIAVSAAIEIVVLPLVIYGLYVCVKNRHNSEEREENDKRMIIMEFEKQITQHFHHSFPMCHIRIDSVLSSGHLTHTLSPL